MSESLVDDDQVDTSCFDGLTCRNGGTCTEDPTQEGSFYCDCSTTTRNKAVYAGLSCEFKATVFCNQDGELNDHSYCTNAGKCKQLVTDEDDGIHYGCTCRPKYTGDFCQYIKGQNVPDDYGPSTATIDNSARSNSTSGVAVAFIVIGLAILAFALGGLVICRRRRLVFWEQHATGLSKEATDMDMSVDGGAIVATKEANNIQPAETVEVFQDVDVDDDDDEGTMTDII